MMKRKYTVIVNVITYIYKWGVGVVMYWFCVGHPPFLVSVKTCNSIYVRIRLKEKCTLFLSFNLYMHALRYIHRTTRKLMICKVSM